VKAAVRFWLEQHPLAAPLATLSAGSVGVATLAPIAWWTLHGTLLMVGLAIVLAHHFQQRYGRGALGEALDALKTETEKLHADTTRIGALEEARKLQHERLDGIDSRLAGIDSRVRDIERTLRPHR